MKFISKELAIKLKEKGFNKPCFGWYNTDNEELKLHLCEGTTRLVLEHPLYCEYIIDAPTIDQVLEWLREECEMLLLPCVTSEYTNDADGVKYRDGVYWYFEIINIISGDRIYITETEEYDTYEDACIAGINFVVEHLI